MTPYGAVAMRTIADLMGAEMISASYRAEALRDTRHE